MEAVTAEGKNSIQKFVSRDKKRLYLSSKYFGPNGAKTLCNSDLIDCKDSLTSLCLSHNNFGCIGIKHLTKTIGSLTLLQQLDLSHNNAGPNGAKYLINVFAELTSLLYLNLSHSGLEPDGAQYLINGLVCCRKLRRLDFSSNNFGSHGAQHLIEVLQSLVELRDLDLSENSFGSHGAQHLILGFKHLRKLKRLNLSSNSFGSDGACHIALAIGDLVNLFDLDLSSNGFGIDGAKHFIAAFSRLHNLRYLNLSDNSLGGGCDYGITGMEEIHSMGMMGVGAMNVNRNGEPTKTTILDYLMDAIGKNCTQLRCLDLSSNGFSCGVSDSGMLAHINEISGGDAKSIVIGLKNLKQLQYLQLSKNDLGPTGAKYIFQGIENLANLTDIHLALNDFGANGAKDLFTSYNNAEKFHGNHNDSLNTTLSSTDNYCWQFMTNIKTLDLSGNGFGANGIRCLIDPFKNCTQIQSLNLSSNNLGSQGALHLIGTLRCFMFLTKLDLSSNGFGCDTIVPIFTSIAYLSNLKHLNLAKNGFGIASIDGGSNDESFHNHYDDNIDEGQKQGNMNNYMITQKQQEKLKEKHQIIGSTLKKLPLLEYLDLSHNNFGPTILLEDRGSYNCAKEYNIILYSISTLRELRHLDLGFNNFGRNGCRNLCYTLQHLQKLEYLNLSNNNFGDEGTKILHDAFNNLKKLKSLNLSSNNIGAIGAKYLTEVLNYSSYKERGTKYHNETNWTDENQINGAKEKTSETEPIGTSAKDSQNAVVVRRPKNKYLQELILSNNHFGPNGAKHLIHAIGNFNRMRHLDLKQNDFGVDGVQHALGICEHLFELEHLDISRNSFGSCGIEKLMLSLTNKRRQHQSQNRKEEEIYEEFHDSQTFNSPNNQEGFYYAELKQLIISPDVELNHINTGF